MIAIRQAHATETDWLQASYAKYLGWAKPDGYFAEVCRLQDAGETVLLIAVDDGEYVAHCKIVWLPDYPNFRTQHIPEIQDLNVRADYRRQGIATQLLDICEQRIKEHADTVGIGFGLYADYGAAQRLYLKRGYIPDGHGIYYQDKPVIAGQSYPIDDDLVLYLTKKL